MHTTIRLYLPIVEEDLESLTIGDRVYLNGTIYTARDAAHKRLVDLIEAGKELPVDLMNAVIFYAGPAPSPPGKLIGSLGPTTSSRMDPYAITLMEKCNIMATIGKGKRSPEFIAACQKFKSVYFIAIAGIAALLQKHIIATETVAYEDLGAESIKRLTVKDFPVIVANDIFGRDIYEEGQKSYQTSLEEILKEI